MALNTSITRVKGDSMPPISHQRVSPEEMIREAMKLTKVLARVLNKEKSKPKKYT